MANMPIPPSARIFDMRARIPIKEKVQLPNNAKAFPAIIPFYGIPRNKRFRTDQ